MEEGERGEGDEGDVDGFLEWEKRGRLAEPEGCFHCARRAAILRSKKADPSTGGSPGGTSRTPRSSTVVKSSTRQLLGARRASAPPPLQRAGTHLHILIQQGSLDVRSVGLRRSQRFVLQRECNGDQRAVQEKRRLRQRLALLCLAGFLSAARSCSTGEGLLTTTIPQERIAPPYER